MSRFTEEISRIESLCTPFHHQKAKIAIDFWLNNWDDFEKLLSEHALEEYEKQKNTPSIFSDSQPSKDDSLIIQKGLCLLRFSRLSATVTEGLIVDKADFKMSFIVPLPEEESKEIKESLSDAIRIFELLKTDPYDKFLDQVTINTSGGTQLRNYIMFLRGELREITGKYNDALHDYQAVVQNTSRFLVQHNPEECDVTRGIGDRALGRIVILQELELFRLDIPGFIKKFKQILTENNFAINQIDESSGLFVLNFSLNEGLPGNLLTIRLDPNSNEAIFLVVSNLKNDGSESSNILGNFLLTRNIVPHYGTWSILDPNNSPSTFGLIHRLPMALSSPNIVLRIINDMCTECRDVTGEIIKISSGNQ